MINKTNRLLTIIFIWGLSVYPGIFMPLRAQQLLDGLLYPRSTHQTLEVKKNHPIYIQLVSDPIYQVLPYYLKLSQTSPWKLTYPQKKEMDTWVSALKHSQKPPVFMLNLYNTKSKLNYHLTLGAVSHASSSPAQTIITLYKAHRPFGR